MFKRIIRRFIGWWIGGWSRLQRELARRSSARVSPAKSINASSKFGQAVKGNQNQVIAEVKDQGLAIANVGRDVYIGVRPKWSGKPFQAPPLPPYFVDRPEPRQALKKLLLDEREMTPGTLVVSAIYGLGGLGKSTLAVALAYDPDVHVRFPDGILWATLGQQPDVLSFLSGWIQALGDYDFKATTPDIASMHLRTLLRNKRILLVVDDVWKSEHVELFRIGSSGCRVLVTTREALVPGAIRYDLDVMKPEQALVLLKHARPELQMSETEQAQAEALAKEVGYLPLALELATAQIADGTSWSELLNELQAEVVCLEALNVFGSEGISSEAKRKQLSLVASFNLSMRQL